MDNNSYAKLVENGIRLHFERNGTLDEMRSGLHVKVLTMLHGAKNLKKHEPLCGGDVVQLGLVRLLNHLVIDYFDWYGYKHTLETFALETGSKNKRSREKLGSELNGNFDRKELPILLQMVMKHVSLTDSANPDAKLQGVSSESDRRKMKKPTPAQSSPLLKPIKVKEYVNQIGDQAEKGSVKADVIPAFSSSNILKKVNVRNRMAGENLQAPSGHRDRARRRQAKKQAELRKQNQSNSDTFSSIESHDDETDETSETFADIPNRYYYRELGPPEQIYPPGHGEEGPYEGQHLQNEDDKLSSQGIKKSKNLKVFELNTREHNLTKSTKSNKSKSPKNSEHSPLIQKRSKFTGQSQRCAVRSDEDIMNKIDLPETMVSRLSLIDSEDSDEYL